MPPLRFWPVFVISIVIVTVGLILLLSASADGPTGQPRMLLSRLSLPSKRFDEVCSKWKEMDHLIIVPGHAIQWCTDRAQNIFDENCWYLLKYQTGQVPIFIEHIRRAAHLAAEDKNALLVFSGGKTRSGLGPRSEGQSYFLVAEKLGLLNRNDLYDRSIAEEFARDSLENLIFSLCRFQQVTGNMPQRVSVVGFPFKARRFIELHRKAANIDSSCFTYVSVDLPGFPQDSIIDDAYNDFAKDLFGCGPKLSLKRHSRNPYNEHHGYLDTCPELRQMTKCS